MDKVAWMIAVPSAFLLLVLGILKCLELWDNVLDRRGLRQLRKDLEWENRPEHEVPSNVHVFKKPEVFDWRTGTEDD